MVPPILEGSYLSLLLHVLTCVIGEWIDLFAKFKTTVVQPKLAEAAAGKAPNLTEERQKSIIDKVEVVDTYFAEINAALEKPKTEDLPYTIE